MSGAFGLGGVVSVLPTVFHEDGSLDPFGIGSLVEAHLAAGVAGLTVLGVMGEAAELSDEERDEVLRAVLAAAGDLPIVLGISAPSSDVVATRSRRAAASGATAVMVSAATTLGLDAAVEAASAGGLPIVVQDYPAGSGVTVTATDLATAARNPLVAGVKAEAPPTASAIAALRELRPSLPIVGGLGGLFLVDELAAGGVGTMTGFALPERLVEIVRDYPRDPEGAARAWTCLLPLMRFEAFPPFSLAARKEVWRLRGAIGSAKCRRAGATLDGTARADVRRAFEAVVVSVPS
ncbi:MAG TPA: dihydrodipicolinate synthase family protein [Candidatus Limnocylindrales bacterium]|nr:dihydrodipicolinate synthase family protein [Candidatus Limnocylindrales bacterium]